MCVDALFSISFYITINIEYLQYLRYRESNYSGVIILNRNLFISETMGAIIMKYPCYIKTYLIFAGTLKLIF